jgi:hypothetical protein
MIPEDLWQIIPSLWCFVIGCLIGHYVWRVPEKEVDFVKIGKAYMVWHEDNVNRMNIIKNYSEISLSLQKYIGENVDTAVESIQKEHPTLKIVKHKSSQQYQLNCEINRFHVIYREDFKVVAITNG